MQATYTFPVGVTTLWWYAPNTSNGPFMNATVAAHTKEEPTRVNVTASETGSAPHYTASVVWSTPAANAAAASAASEAPASESSAFNIRGARWW